MNWLNTHIYDEKNNIETNNNFNIEQNKWPSEEEQNKFRDDLEKEKNVQKNTQNSKMLELINELDVKNILNKYSLKEWWQSHLKQKFSEIEKIYGDWIKTIELTEWDTEWLSKYMEKYVDINNSKVQINLKKLIETCKWLWKRNGEHIFALIGTDWSIHLVNDIDTGHYIIPKGLIENWDIWSLAKPSKIDPNKMERWGKEINLEGNVWGNELLEVWKNKPLINKQENLT